MRFRPGGHSLRRPPRASWRTWTSPSVCAPSAFSPRATRRRRPKSLPGRSRQWRCDRSTGEPLPDVHERRRLAASGGVIYGRSITTLAEAGIAQVMIDAGAVRDAAPSIAAHHRRQPARRDRRAIPQSAGPRPSKGCADGKSGYDDRVCVTRRWREQDSNPRSPRHGPRAAPQRPDDDGHQQHLQRLALRGFVARQLSSSAQRKGVLS